MITKDGLLSAAPDFITMLGGMNTIQQGADIAVAGYQMEASTALAGGQYSADVYRTYESGALQMANYRKALSKNQSDRQLSVVASQINQVMAKNQAIQGGNGLGFGSASYLAVSNSYLSDTERQIVQMRNTELQKQQGITYEGQLESNRYENQARSAEYAGQVSANNAQYKSDVADYEASSKNMSNLVSGATSAYDTLMNPKKVSSS
jgi:hypothetical protein